MTSLNVVFSQIISSLSARHGSPDGQVYDQPGKQQRPERRASLGIMGEQLRALLEPLFITANVILRGLMEAFNWSPIMLMGTTFRGLPM